MKPILAQLRPVFYVIAPILVLLIAALLASLLSYFLVSTLGLDLSFRSVFKRTSQIVLVLAIVPLMAILGLNRQDLGFAPRPLFFRQLRDGFALGFCTLLPIFLLLWFLGIHVIDESRLWTPAWIAKKMTLELLLAALIAFFEEPLFRGILLAAFRKSFAVFWSISLSAFYYAILHFLNSNTEIADQELHWHSGLKLLGEAFQNIINPEILPAFFALFAVGLFLGTIRTRSHLSLGLCIGCHASWVWLIKLNKLAFNVNPESNQLYLVSAYDGVIGPLVTVWLLAATALYCWIQHRKRLL